MVTLQITHENDFIANIFCTVDNEKDNKSVSLHYFEHSHDLKGNFLRRTYNIFNLNQDFWDLIENSNFIPPTNKKAYIKKQTEDL